MSAPLVGAVDEGVADGGAALPRQPGYLTITVPADLLAAYVGLFRAAESGSSGTALRAACTAVRQAGG